MQAGHERLTADLTHTARQHGSRPEPRPLRQRLGTTATGTTSVIGIKSPLVQYQTGRDDRGDHLTGTPHDRAVTEGRRPRVGHERRPRQRIVARTREHVDRRRGRIRDLDDEDLIGVPGGPGHRLVAGQPIRLGLHHQSSSLRMPLPMNQEPAEQGAQ